MPDQTAAPFSSFTATWHCKPYPLISPNRAANSAHGKTVVVTGSASGIGKAVAIAFAQAGAEKIILLGRRLDRLESAAKEVAAATSGSPPKVLCESADLVDTSQVVRAFDAIVNKAGKIDILVHAAGLKTDITPLITYDVGQVSRSFEVNVIGSVNAIQAFAARAGPSPILLNVASGTAHMDPVQGEGPYNASKLAALKLVQQFGFENPSFHVVNIHPGWVPTEMNGMMKEAPDSPDLPGKFCVWLASAEAKFLNGKMVWANWDAEELIQRAEEIKSSSKLTLGLRGSLI